MEKIVIIGHGPAGLTSAIYAARAGLEPLVVHSNAELGQLDQTTDVENFPGFPEGVMGPQMIVNMHNQAERFGAKFKIAHVSGITGEGPYLLNTDQGDIETHTIVIATGARPRRLGLESEAKYWGNGVSACAVCDGFFYRNQQVMVIGGGDSACEEATFLTKFAAKVTLVHRRGEFRASKIMGDKVLANEKIDVQWNTALDEVLGTEADGVTGVRLKDTETGETREMDMNGVFLGIGHIPNTAPFKGFIDLDEEGYVLVSDGTKTSKKGVFAAGDLHDKVYRQAITAAGFGCMAALDAEKYLEEHLG